MAMRLTEKASISIIGVPLLQSKAKSCWPGFDGHCGKFLNICVPFMPCLMPCLGALEGPKILQTSIRGEEACGMHDGSQLSAGRAKVAGHTIPHRCVLAEVRADWKCLSEVFGLPNWKSTSGICARCSATPESFRDFSSEAAWRCER